MNDDLISRKAVIEEVKRYRDAEYSNNDRTSRALSYVVEIIKNQPTAFDKEKVIEDLNDWMKDAEKWATKYDEVGDTDNMDLQDMAARCYKNAIKIVEKGGIE